MLIMTYYLLIILGFAFLLFAVLYERTHIFWNLSAILISIIIFIVVSLGSVDIAIPYQVFNATDGNITIDTQRYYEDYPLLYLWLMIAIIEFFYFLYVLFDEISKIFKVGKYRKE